jgi:hypothetical protein
VRGSGTTIKLAKRESVPAKMYKHPQSTDPKGRAFLMTELSKVAATSCLPGMHDNIGTE